MCANYLIIIDKSRIVLHRSTITPFSNENTLEGMEFCLSEGFSVELDVFGSNEGIYLGHELDMLTKIKREDIDHKNVYLHIFPTYYDKEQVDACDLVSTVPAAALAKKINPLILKGTNIVQVSYRARDSQLETVCLNAQMDRVIRG